MYIGSDAAFVTPSVHGSRGAEAVHDILARIQDTLIHIGHEEEDEITEEISTIRSKYSKRKTTAFKRGLLELLGEGKDQGKDEGKTDNSKE